ncbi:MAG TPA: Wzy polymerase domain-containing protein, partial [Methylophilaceae bacterium]|nr:Wzy polymerase domain-containing protein [Methylophilaceae bacterium]
ADGAKANAAKVFFIGLIPAFALLQVVVHLPWFASSAPMITAMDRMEHAGGNFSDRMNIWHAAWIMFKDAPWFGLGWGEFDWGYFERASLLAVSTVDQRVNHAHNLFMQLLAETGTVGLLLVVMGVATWLLRVLRAGYHRDRYSSSHSPLPCFLLFAVLGVLGIHTMLEYPLWYAHFLGIAALLMGLADPQDFPVGSSLRRAIVLISGIGLFLATSLAWDYNKIEHWLVSARRFQVVDADLPQFREDMLSVRRNPLLAPYVDVTLALSAEPSLDHLQDKLTLSTSAMHFEPVADLVFAQAVLLSLAGRQEEAYRLLDMALVAYPASAGKQVKELSILSVRDPGTYRPLLEYVQSRLERKQNSAAVSD